MKLPRNYKWKKDVCICCYGYDHHQFLGDSHAASYASTFSCLYLKILETPVDKIPDLADSLMMWL